MSDLINIRELHSVLIAVGCCCTALLCSYTWKKFQHWKRRQELLAKIQRKHIERQQQLDELKAVPSDPEENAKITSLGLEELLEELQSGKLTAVQVLRAYVAKAVSVTEEFNCVTEFIPWAESLANELDSLSVPRGPLHGLPVAIKDDHDVEGMDSTIGFAKYLYKPAMKNSVPVQILIDLGAVPFCKTNVPQALASINSDNPVFGTTLNGLNKSASPGGSSGGSGSIIGAGGALVATGSDLAGSLRIPAHFHGLCALRTTNGRLSRRGMQGNLKHVITTKSVTGFITKDVKSQVTLYKLVTGDKLQSRYDPTVAPLPWNEALFSSTFPLKIGYFTSLPIFPAFGDTPLTIMRAKAVLEQRNYELVEFPLPDTVDLSRSIFGLFWCDLGKNLLAEFEHEPLSNSGKALVSHANTSVWVRNFLSWLFSLKALPSYSPRAKELLGIGVDYQSREKFCECIHHLNELRGQVLTKMEEEGIHLLLGPVMPFPAMEEKITSFFSMSVIYTYIWNVLDMPAGVVRFGTETGKLINEACTEDDHFLKMAKKALRTSVGHPINVQLIGRPYQEELVLRGLSELESSYEKLSHKVTNGNSTNGKPLPS